MILSPYPLTSAPCATKPYQYRQTFRPVNLIRFSSSRVRLIRIRPEAGVLPLLPVSNLCQFDHIPPPFRILAPSVKKSHQYPGLHPPACLSGPTSTETTKKEEVVPDEELSDMETTAELSPMGKVNGVQVVDDDEKPVNGVQVVDGDEIPVNGVRVIDDDLYYTLDDIDELDDDVVTRNAEYLYGDIEPVADFEYHYVELNSDPDISYDELVDLCVKTLAKVVESEETAVKMINVIYATKEFVGFKCRRLLKIYENITDDPTVLHVYPQHFIEEEGLTRSGCCFNRFEYLKRHNL